MRLVGPLRRAATFWRRSIQARVVVSTLVLSAVVVTLVGWVLIRQITAPVRWEESVAAMRGVGADAFLEVGPGKVLSGLLRRIDKDAPTAAFCGLADLDGARGLTA